jgi:histidine triad (HIT) family protein
VLETDEAIAFLDIHPVNLGHVLIVPKEHHADLTELSEPLAAHVGGLLPGICRAVRTATGADGVNVIVNIGRAAGQTIDHGHWHVIPRFIDDPVNWPWPHSEYVGDELGQMRFRIERELNPRSDD